MPENAAGPCMANSEALGKIDTSEVADLSRLSHLSNNRETEAAAAQK